MKGSRRVRPVEEIIKLYDLDKTRKALIDFFQENNQDISPRSQESYISSFHQFFKFCKIEYDQVASRDIENWVNVLVNHGYNKATIAYRHSNLCVFYNYCFRKGLISVDPVVNINKVTRKTIDDGIWPIYKLERTQEVVNHYIEDNRLRLGKHTIDTYKLGYLQFFEFIKNDFDQVTAKDIRYWISMLDEQGYKIRTLQFKLIGLQSFYRYCMEEGLLEKDPTLNIRLPKIRKAEQRPNRYVEPKTLAQLMELTKDKPLDQAIIATLYSTGIRVGELLNIRREDIDWDNRQIMIRHGKGNKDRMVLFTAECSVKLKRYASSHTGPYLFSRTGEKPYGQTMVRNRFNNYTKALKLDHPVTPHSMRHTFASQLAQKGMPLECIQELLGHEDIQTTQYYAKLNATAKKKLYDYYV